MMLTFLLDFACADSNCNIPRTASIVCNLTLYQNSGYSFQNHHQSSSAPTQPPASNSSLRTFATPVTYQHANLRLSVRKVKNTPTAELHQTLQNSLKTRPKTLLIFLKYIEQGRNEMAQVIVEPTTQNYDKGSETSNKELIVETGDG